MNYTINLKTVSQEAFDHIWNLDRDFIGTDNYLGVAYFWHHAFRYHMREATISQRRRVHKKLIEAGVPVGSYPAPETYSDDFWKTYCSVISSVVGCSLDWRAYADTYAETKTKGCSWDWRAYADTYAETKTEETS